MAWNHIVTYTAIGLMVLVLIGQRLIDGSKAITDVEAQSSPQMPSVSASPSTSSSNLPRLLKVNFSLSSHKDLRVKQGDTVTAGEVLADRVEERSHLTGQRQALILAFNQIQARTITAPPAPMPVPTVKNLPPISYAEEEAAIRAAATTIVGAERALQLQQESLKSEPLEESAGVRIAEVEVQNRQRGVDNQLRKIDAVAMLKDLPPSVAIHEQEVLKRRSAELQQSQAEYQQAQAKLSAASKAQVEKLQQLAASLEKARADRQLAIAKLQTKKDQRAYSEYEASVTAARRTEERNQAAENYSRQLQEAEQRQRDRSFQMAQIQAKIAEVDDKLRTLSVVTSPYTGVVRRIKILGQNDNNLSIQLTLVVDGGGKPNNGTAGQPLLAPKTPGNL